jgi:hypothetical protein
VVCHAPFEEIQQISDFNVVLLMEEDHVDVINLLEEDHVDVTNLLDNLLHDGVQN